MASPTFSPANGGTKIEPHVLHVSICVEDAVTKVRLWPMAAMLTQAVLGPTLTSAHAQSQRLESLSKYIYNRLGH